MKKKIISLVKLPDLIFARIYLRFFGEKKALIIYCFHILFRNEDEINLNLVDPQLGITVDHFRQFVEYYRNHNYQFISHNDLIKGLYPNQNYIMITFDDGYFNNVHALPILQRYKIPAIFFISTDQIIKNKCFWWDVLYREGIKSGISASKIKREGDFLKAKTTEEIEHYLKNQFGENVFNPISDIDRPFTPMELKNFSKEKFVFIGNHTKDHTILTKYSIDEMKSQIRNAQNDINEITGTSPIIIAYPDGEYSDKIINASKDIGLQVGVTVDLKKNYLPINCQKDDYMRLGRFDLGDSIEPLQLCELFRSDKIFYKRFLNFLNKK